MTYEEREEIFAKELLTVQDLQKLYDCSEWAAAEIIRDIRRKMKVENRPMRISERGKLHTQDYLDYFRITPDNLRYAKKEATQ